MSARLDHRQTGADYSGGTSDPRLVNKLALIGPSEPLTLEQMSAALDVVAHYAGKKKLSHRSGNTLQSMIFGTENA